MLDEVPAEATFPDARSSSQSTTPSRERRQAECGWPVVGARRDRLRGRRYRAQCGCTADRADDREHGRSPGAGRQPRPFAASQWGAVLRPRDRARLPARYPRRHRGAVSNPASPNRSGSYRSAATVSARLTLTPPRPAGCPMTTLSQRAVRTAVRPDHRRPDPTGGHRPVHRDHRGPQRWPRPGR